MTDRERELAMDAWGRVKNAAVNYINEHGSERDMEVLYDDLHIVWRTLKDGETE